MQIRLSKKEVTLSRIYTVWQRGDWLLGKVCCQVRTTKKLEVVSACEKEHRTIWVNINVFKRKPDTGILESKLVCCKIGNFYVHLLNQCFLKKENKTTNTWEVPNYFQCNS